MPIYTVANGPSPAAAAVSPVAVNASGIKTMLQLLHATQGMSIIEVSIGFDAVTAAVPFTVEAITTGTVNATVTAFVANDVTTYDGPADSNVAAAGGLTITTAGSGYTASAEGTVAAPVRQGGLWKVPNTFGQLVQLPLGQEFYVPATHCFRVRVTAASVANALVFVKFKIGGD